MKMYTVTGIWTSGSEIEGSSI